VQPYNNLIWNAQNVEADNGQTDTGPWFEWWYYKVVLPGTGDAFYFCYGVVNPWDTTNSDPASQAFVGFGNFNEHVSVMQPYPVSNFAAAYDKTDIAVASNHATAMHISGGVSNDVTTATWDINIDSRWDFNAMGWGMFVPEVSNIYWYPAQADARFSGQIVYNGKTYTFDNAPGYQDRNWGRSFPAWWAWIVGNHFDGHPDTAFAAGGGQPTLLGGVNFVEGLAIGLRHGGHSYEFRPSTGDLERFTVSFGTWEVDAINKDGYRIKVTAEAPCDSFLDLVFQTPQGVRFHDFETLTGSLTVKLFEWNADRWQLLETLHSDFAGIEYGNADTTIMDCHSGEEKVLYSNF
jgi:tocopherol cyclase